MLSGITATNSFDASASERSITSIRTISSRISPASDCSKRARIRARSILGGESCAGPVIDAGVDVDQQRTDAIIEPSRDATALVGEAPTLFLGGGIRVVCGREDHFINSTITQTSGSITARRRRRASILISACNHKQGTPSRDARRVSAGQPCGPLHCDLGCCGDPLSCSLRWRPPPSRARRRRGRGRGRSTTRAL